MKTLTQKITEARKLDEAEIKELKGGMTIKAIKMWFPWILKAETKDAVISSYKDNLVWESGTWISGTWEDGIWKGGTWITGRDSKGNVHKESPDKW